MSSGFADGADEIFEFLGGFFAVGGFDAAADIDGVWLEQSHDIAYVLGREAAGDDYRGKIFELPAGLQIVQVSEIAGDAGTAALGSGARGFHHQGNQIGEMKIGNRLAPGVERRGIARGEMQGFDDANGFEIGDELGGFIAVQLRDIQRDQGESFLNFIDGSVYENSHGCDERTGGFDNFGGGLRGDVAAGGGIEDDSNGIGAGTGGGGGIGGAADAVDFYPRSLHVKMVIDRS